MTEIEPQGPVGGGGGGGGHEMVHGCVYLVIVQRHLKAVTG